MHLVFLVEESSAREALNNLIPMIVGTAVTFEIHPFQGKRDLLAKLPYRLRAYRRWMPADWKIVVLIDADNNDCRELKDRLEKMALQAGLMPKTAAGGSQFQVLNRIAVEELEAWFFGDVEALSDAYPGIPKGLANNRRFRDPDAVSGGTWETLERVLQRAGYFKGGLEKVRAAREISMHMNPDRNRSKSFQVFRQGLLDLVA